MPSSLHGSHSHHAPVKPARPATTWLSAQQALVVHPSHCTSTTRLHAAINQRPIPPPPPFSAVSQGGPRALPRPPTSTHTPPHIPFSGQTRGCWSGVGRRRRGCGSTEGCRCLASPPPGSRSRRSCCKCGTPPSCTPVGRPCWGDGWAVGELGDKHVCARLCTPVRLRESSQRLRMSKRAL
jgi:hypothetical protein